MSTAIVTTTINVPKLLLDYGHNARRFGHQELKFIVIGDMKTPQEASDYCRKVSAQTGYEVQYLSVADQVRYLTAWPRLADHLPWNSIQRRNVGLLKAYQDGVDVVITIDDDNLVQPDSDFVGEHNVVGQVQEQTEVVSSSGWYNVCVALKEKQSFPFYHRGYPLGQRWQNEQTEQKLAEKRIVVNAGLWLEAPDIDAIAWLNWPIEATEIEPAFKKGVSLAPGTWSPFNSQNTALARDVLPAYFLSPLIGRYDDIWASYILKKIADHLDDRIHFGPPYVRQERNKHNYLRDLQQEMYGMTWTDAFCEQLRQIKLMGTSYQSCLSEIVSNLLSEADSLFEGQAGDQKVFKNFLEGLVIWQDIYHAIPERV